jgi:hypothetical protein
LQLICGDGEAKVVCYFLVSERLKATLATVTLATSTRANAGASGSVTVSVICISGSRALVTDNKVSEAEHRRRIGAVRCAPDVLAGSLQPMKAITDGVLGSAGQVRHNEGPALTDARDSLPNRLILFSWPYRPLQPLGATGTGTCTGSAAATAAAAAAAATTAAATAAAATAAAIAALGGAD